MKTKRIRVTAVLLAFVLAFSAMATGSAAFTQPEAISAATLANPDASSDTYSEVATVEEAVALLEADAAAQAAAAEDKGPVEYIPTIVLPGISQSYSYLADENNEPVLNKDGDELGGGLLIIDSSTIADTLLGTLAMPLIRTLLAQRDMGFTDAVYDTVKEVFWIQESKKDGTSVNNLQTETFDCSIGEMTEEDRAQFYRYIPMQDYANQVGEENVYFFAFPLIADPFDSAVRLDEYIQMVKAARGVDKVNIVSVSLGGTILTAYLDLENVDGSDLHNIVNVVSLLNGTDLMGDFLDRTFNLDEEFIYSEYIPSIFMESEGYGTYGYLINLAIRIFPRDIFEKTLTRAVDGILETLVINCPQFWAMVPIDRYEALADRYLVGDDYAVLRAKTDRFHQAQSNLEQNLLDAVAQGAKVNNICGYDLTYGDGDYNFFSIMASSRTTNSDGIIDIDSTSLGATFAPSNTVLGYDGAYVSPDQSVDLSTALFPNNVWLFYNQHHEVGRNDVVLKLAGKILTDELVDVNSDPANYPQFNGTRNTKNITRWYLSEAETVFETEAATPGTYNAADLEELHAAYDEALALLQVTNITSGPESAEATSERLLNALRRVGVRGQASDKSTDVVLEALTKLMSDAVFEFYGPQGFSDWLRNGVPASGKPFPSEPLS
ncbi:MAG: hypothetical protein GX851_01065 [Clostridiales bacterium]|nr:hypothetical protein [Clostridiales bacterium]